jgi:hypothetical protein
MPSQQKPQPPTPEQIADALYKSASKDSDFEVFICKDGGRVIVVKPRPAPRFDAFIKSLGPPAEVRGEPPKN